MTRWKRAVLKIVIAGAIAAGVAWIAMFQASFKPAPRRSASSDDAVLARIPFDGKAAFAHLEQLCALGPRPTGSPEMQKQQEMLTEHFKKVGGLVSRQEFEILHPLHGTPVSVANLVVQWHPDRRERILLCAHYDTRPFPDRDPRNPRGRFIGANDGGSGVAVLMELAHDMPSLPGRYGVDFVLFDAEEFIFDERTGKYFVGSEHFARQYLANPSGPRYRQGVLLDMVGDADLQLYLEPNSLRYARDTTRGIWDTARRLGVREFIFQPLAQGINDDHIPLNEIARISTCDIIDFHYPAWHTQDDTPAQCSAASLAKVGWVVHEWLKTAVH